MSSLSLAGRQHVIRGRSAISGAVHGQSTTAKSPVVMKFGGSSVADHDKLRQVANLVVSRAKDQSVVVVVSAMGSTTSELIAEAQQLCSSPAARELDMLLSTGERHSMALLALAIQDRNVPAISLTGSQCGIMTDHRHGKARVVEVRPFRILDELEQGRVVIVGGFQGVSYKREVTTLGRGGSDSTAVALAAALEADCEIYSDVDGIYTADPRVVADAQHLSEISYDEMHTLSRAGAKVLYAQAVEMARKHNIAIYARATSGSKRETIVRRDVPSNLGVRAVASDRKVSHFRLVWQNPAPVTVVSELANGLGTMGLRHFSVDPSGVSGVLSGLQRNDQSVVESGIGALVDRLSIDWELAIDRWIVRSDLAEITCVGAGIDEHPEIVTTAVHCLATANIGIVALFTQAHAMAVLVDHQHVDQATQLLHGELIA